MSRSVACARRGLDGWGGGVAGGLVWVGWLEEGGLASETVHYRCAQCT